MDMAMPRLFQTYNNNMGGVDELDQSVSLYRIAVCKKWWWVLFTYMLDVAIANAWRLHVMSNDDPMDQLMFRRHIARYYLRQGDQRDRVRLQLSVVFPKMELDTILLKLKNSCGVSFVIQECVGSVKSA